MLIAITQPYKAEFAVYNIVDTVFILILALYYCALMCVDIASMKDHRYKTTSKVAMGVVAVLPLFYITAITLHWLCSRTKIGRNMIRKIRGCAPKTYPWPEPSLSWSETYILLQYRQAFTVFHFIT